MKEKERDVKKLASDFAESLFHDRKDKGGHPYMEHLIRVAEMAEGTLGTEGYVVGILHDCIEDIEDITPEVLSELFGESVARRVSVLTRAEGERYEDYIGRIILENDFFCTFVKIFDLMDNMSPSRLHRDLKNSDLARIKRYHNAYIRLGVSINIIEKS